MADPKNKIIDINLSVTEKKQFRIDGDDNRIIELNTSDLSILSRIQNCYPRLDALSMKATDLSSDSEENEENAERIVTVLSEIDAEMREILDFVFDSKIADICAPSGTMFDMFNGEFRFEHIMNTLIPLYENNIDAEYKLMAKRIKKRTSKYTGK